MYIANQFKEIVRDFQKCLSIAPLPIISLLIYLGLTSTNILPGGLHIFNEIYHPAYLGWYDFVLGYSIIFTFAIGLLKLEVDDLFFGLILLFIILASWINTYEQDKAFIFDGIVCYLRFFLVFMFAKSLVRRLNYQTAESLLMFAYGLLAVSAVLWYSLQFGTNNRMAASAMTPPSFSQVSGIICLILYGKRYYFFLFFSFIFLFLTFSRTSLLLFFVIILIQNRQIIPWNLVKYIIGFAILAAVAITIMIKYGGQATEVVLESRLSTDEISNLNGRNYIWTRAIEIIKSGQIPLFGVGFNMTPSLIFDHHVKFMDAQNEFHSPPSFHNILFEYSLGLGILSSIIFFYFIKRIWQTFQHNCCPAFFIFAYFFATQNVDYTFYTPKEIIIFSLMLGLAEGQWRYEGKLKNNCE